MLHVLLLLLLLLLRCFTAAVLPHRLQGCPRVQQSQPWAAGQYQHQHLSPLLLLLLLLLEVCGVLQSPQNPC
jgi:hypothetical protein